MKNWINKQRIILIILILIILSGIITLGVIGFEKSSDYTAGTRIEIYLPKGYEKQDIVYIAKESFLGREVSFSEIEKLNQVAGIKISDYSKEELENFKTKISERYEMDKDSIELYEVSLPATNISTVVMPYVLPMLLVTILSLVYIGIKNFKSNDILKIFLKILAIVVMALAIYFSIIVLFRLPFGRYTMPLALAIYVIALLIAINNKKK